jgi:carbonic anhydrase
VAIWLWPVASRRAATRTIGPTNIPNNGGKLNAAYSAYSEGRLQAPIDLRNATLADLPSLKIDYKPVPLGIIDNGHTIQVKYPSGSTLSVGTKTYALQQFHFHHPSEERINGKEFPLVVHLVHADNEGHLMVIAVLFEIGSANALIDTLWRNVLAQKEGVHELSSVAVQASELLPSDLSYFTFQRFPGPRASTPQALCRQRHLGRRSPV